MRAAELSEDGGHWVQRIPAKEWYSVQDVAMILSVGSTQVYQYIERGSMVGYLVDGKKRVKHEDLVAYIGDRLEKLAADKSVIGTIQRIVPIRRAGPASGGPGKMREVRVTHAISRETLAQATKVPTVEGDIPSGGLDLDTLDLQDDQVRVAVEQPVPDPVEDFPDDGSDPFLPEQVITAPAEQPST